MIPTQFSTKLEPDLDPQQRNDLSLYRTGRIFSFSELLPLDSRERKERDWLSVY